MALFETIRDDFESGAFSSQWTKSSGTIISGGRASILADTTGHWFRTSSGHTLAGSSIHAEMFPAPQAGATTTGAYSYMAIESATAGTRLIVLQYPSNNTIRFHNQVAHWDGSGPTITYDPVAHRWWRIREASGTTYFDTSPDGVTWTNQYAPLTPDWVTTGTSLLLRFLTDRADGDMTGRFEVDNVNITPASLTRATMRVKQADGSWPLATLHRIA